MASVLWGRRRPAGAAVEFLSAVSGKQMGIRAAYLGVLLGERACLLLGQLSWGEMDRRKWPLNCGFRAEQGLGRQSQRYIQSTLE